MKNLILIMAIILTSSSWAKSINDCLDAECLRERATNFKAFLKAEEEFTNELGKTFPNSMLDKLVTNFVDEIRMDFNNANIDRETTLSQMKNNIRDNGIHAAFVDPAIVFMDMYASLGKKDKVQSMANIVNTLNPAIGDTIEKDFGIEIDRNYDPNFDAPKRQLNLPSNFNPTKREQGKDQFGGPRMGQFGNEFDGSLGAPKRGKEDGMSNGLKPRMGNTEPGMNEGEMISPILANKLEQDKNSLLYSMASTSNQKKDVKRCFSKCGVITVLSGLGGLLSTRSPQGMGIGLGFGVVICTIHCAPNYDKPKKSDNPETDTPKVDEPRMGVGVPDVPEDKPEKPESPEVDNPGTGGDDQPVDDDAPKGDDEPNSSDKPKDPKKLKTLDEDDNCKGADNCTSGRVIDILGRVKSDIDVYDDNVNLDRELNINLMDLQINFGRPQFGN